MSLEAKIAELTTAVQVLTEVLTAGGVPVVNGKANPSSKVPPVQKAVKAAAAAPAAEESEGDDTPPPAFLKKEAAAAKPVAAKAAPAPAKAAPVKKTTTADYAPVKEAILAATAAGHRKSVSDMLAEYDAKTGQDLDPSVYTEVLEKLAVIMGGVDDAELA